MQPDPNQPTQPVTPPEFAPATPPVQPENSFAQPAPTQPVQPIAGPAAPAFNPNDPTPSPSKGPNMKIVIVIIAVVLFLLGAAGMLAYYMLTGDKKDDTTTQTTTTGESKDVVDRTDGKLDLTSTIDGNESIKAQDIKAGLNQQVNISNGLSFMITKVERNYTGITNPKAKVYEGQEVVRVSLTVGSRNSGNSVTKLSTSDFDVFAGQKEASLRNGDDTWAVADSLDSRVSFKEAGEQVTGSYIFIVDKDAEMSFVYTANYKNYKTEEKVAIKAIVNL